MLFQDSVGQANHMDRLVVLEQLKRRTCVHHVTVGDRCPLRNIVDAQLVIRLKK